MRERDGVGRAHAQRTAAREVVQRARDDPEADRVELAEKRGHAAWQCPVDERLEEDRFGAVLPLVHRDELSEHGVGRLTARTPSLDAPDERLGSAAQRVLDETLLRRGVQIDGACGDAGAPGDLCDSERGVPTARDLAQRRTFDRGGRASGPLRTFALHVASGIHCI